MDLLLILYKRNQEPLELIALLLENDKKKSYDRHRKSDSL